ncbi:transposase [Okeania sp. KiyG1]|uniref:transposase n=1 Tax=Okeania sp. KiyG1 TaxID=2720165 RepID=UPI001F1D7229|nr:transposase [Okeania sp. KiyG1]
MELFLDGNLLLKNALSCGFKGGKKELNVREWTCLNCGTLHDSLRLTGGYRDINAAINILEVIQPKTKVETTEAKVIETPVQLSLFNEVAEGHSETIKRTRSRRKSSPKKDANGNDVSTRSESPIQLRLFD